MSEHPIHVRIERDGAEASIVLDRPPLNIVDTAMLLAIADAVDAFAGDDDVRLVRLAASGRMFSAGVDVADHVADRLDPMLDALVSVFTAFERLTCPSIAIVQGPALGGGMELALATDLCVARADATFAQPEIKLGLFAPPASVLLPRRIGERQALGILLTGETLSAVDALRLGLVNKVFPVDGFDEAAHLWCRRMLSLSGVALRIARDAVRIGRSGETAEAHRAVLALYRERLMATADAAEGMRAFQEKRAPHWSHR